MEIRIILIFLCSGFIKCYASHTYEILPKENKCEFYFKDGGFEEFHSIVKTFNRCTNLIPSPTLFVQFQNYNLPAFPDGSFTNFGYLNKFHLQVVDGSKIQLLSAQIPGYSVFENVTAKSIIFDINDVPTLVGWNWDVLKDLNPSVDEGMEFIAVRSKLLYLHSDFRKMAKSRLTAVRILKCQLKWLGVSVFATFSGLRTLELRDNLIESIDRSHLPISAFNLRILDLGKNRLAHIPENLFQELPVAEVYLDGNNIQIADIEKTLKLNKIAVSVIMNERNLTVENRTDKELREIIANGNAD